MVFQHFFGLRKKDEFKATETKRIEVMVTCELNDRQAESAMMRAMYDREIIAANALGQVLQEWRKPKHDAFGARNAWSLYNAFTTVIGEKYTGHEQARRTMRLGQFVMQEFNLAL